MTQPSSLNELAAEWQQARLLYPLYAALAREFVIELPRCSDLESDVEAPPQESVEQARQWFLDVDQRIHVYQLRQFLQTTSLTSDEGLKQLLLHHLRKAEHSDSDRDKVDFLLVQYFSHCAPSRLEDRDVDLDYVAQVLEPVLGTVDLTLPERLKPLDDLLTEANNCKGLNELLTSRILEKGRKLKTGGDYYVPAAMVAFTRFSFLMRRTFFRFMHQDLNAILDGLRQLEINGITTLDCRRAQFSADEPVARLRMICQSWKLMFHAEYSSGQPLRMLVDLRGVIDSTLERQAKTGKQASAEAPAAARTHAAAAGAIAASDAHSQEFEVSTHAVNWDEDAASSSSDPSHDPSNS